MSLAIGMTGVDGVVLAADSRGTIGDPRGLTAMNDTMQKLFPLSPRAGCAVFGSAEMGLAVLTNFRGWATECGLDVGSLPVEQVAEQFSNVARQSYGTWFPNMPSRPELGMVIGGLSALDVPAIYIMLNQLDFVPMPSPSGFHFGGIVNYAVYLAHRFYRRDMSIANLTRLSEYLIYETSTQDPKVGGDIDIATISAPEGYNELAREEVRELRERNNALSERLRESFVGGACDVCG